MKKRKTDNLFDNLPCCARDFIELVIKKMRYRKKVRVDVMAEFVAHFEDELRDCKTDEEKQQRSQQLIEEFGDVKLLATLLRRAKKRCRPLWRTIIARTFQTIGVLILCFIFYCVYISTGQPTVRINYVEEMTRLNRPVADESLNAAVLYQKVIDIYEEPPQIKSEESLRAKSLLKLIRNKGVDDLTVKEITALRQWISNNVDAIDFFKQASDKPYCWWNKTDPNNPPLINILFPEMAPMKNIARVINWHAKLQAYNGDVEGALDNLLALYKAGQHFKGPRTFVEQLVGRGMQFFAIRSTLEILNNQGVSNQLLKNFQDKLEDMIAKDTYVIDYRAERFFVFDFIQRCYTDNGKGSGHMIPAQLKKSWNMNIPVSWDVKSEDEESFDIRFLAMAVASADRRQISRMLGNAYDNFQKYAYKTPWEIRKDGVDLEMGLRQWPLIKQARYWPICVFLPSVAKINELSYRNKTEGEALVTVIVLLRYKRDKDNYPENLEQLIVDGYLKELPMDPYSDKPLIYKKTKNDFMLYSVGRNFTDDGGVSGTNKKGKVRQWAEDGDAVFWPVQN